MTLKRIVSVIFLLFGAVLFSLALIFFTPESADKKPLEKKNGSLARVVRVIDGDTIEVEGGQRIRYIGIDAPELNFSGRVADCFAKEAAKENEILVLGKEVRLEKDVSETDDYGRFLRYVWADDVFVNDYLVENGYARVVSFPPDVRYQDQFLKTQEKSRQENRGLWSFCYELGIN